MIQPGWTRQFFKNVIPFLKRIWAKVHGVLKRTQFKLGWIALLVLAVAVAAGVWSLVHFWDWLQTGEAGRETGSTTVRNVGLLIAGFVALPLALWRSLVAQRQADATQRQSVTAQQDLLNERYQRGAEMLGSDVLAVRLGGIYALERLAEEHPEHYHIQNMRLLCAFVRHPSGAQGEQGDQPSGETDLIDIDPERDPKSLVREDVQAILRAIGDRSEQRRLLEEEANFRTYLQNANLGGADLDDVDLRLAKLAGANLRRAVVNNANLYGANLFKADLSFSELRKNGLYKRSHSKLKDG